MKTPTPFHKDLLNLLDLDVTEHGRADFVDVVLYGNDDVDILRQAGLEYEVEIPDLAARRPPERTQGHRLRGRHRRRRCRAASTPTGTSGSTSTR